MTEIRIVDSIRHLTNTDHVTHNVMTEIRIVDSVRHLTNTDHLSRVML